MIRKQSIQTSLLSYVGVGLGYVNVVLLFPKFFAPEEFGLTRVLIAIISIAAQMSLIGMSNAVIRFFPQFRDGSKNHRGFLGVVLSVASVGTLIGISVLTVFKPLILANYEDKSDLLGVFYYLIFPYLAFEVLFQLFSAYARAMYHTVVNIFFREVLVRALTTLLIALYHFNLFEFDWFMNLFVLQYGVLTLGMIGYLVRINGFHVRIDREFLTPKLKRSLLNYGAYTLLSGVSSIFVMNVDVMMIGAMIGLDETAFYAVAFYIVSLLRIPKNAFGNVVMPVVADAWKNNDLAKIQGIYEKTSINQLLFGMLLFVGIWANETNIFAILPAQYAGGKWVLFAVGIGRLVETAFGLSQGIMALSKWYRMDVYLSIFLLVATVGFNLLLIPPYGITGAAIATAISLTLANLLRFSILYAKAGLNPFSTRSVLVVVIGVVSYGVNQLVPVQDNLMFDIVLRSSIVSLVFIPLVLAFRVSEDVNQLMLSILKRITER